MQVFGWTIARTKALPPLRPLSRNGGGWWPIIVREPSTGAWQRNEELRADTVLTYSAVFACVTLIASDIAKLSLRLVQQDRHDIWTETESPAFSPVLRKPNRYQIRQTFLEQWLVSKLVHGNTYVLKQRDQRGVVVALYVLDPTRVTPLVTPDGAVYYQLARDDLSTLAEPSVVVPASEIMHDLMVPLYHPLVGVTPIYACGSAALQGLAIQRNSSSFFANGSTPGGMILVPGDIAPADATRLTEYWNTNYSGENVGKVALLSNGMKYEPFSVNAVDAQLIEQLKWTGETVCSCYHVPAYMVGIGPPPPYANVGPLLQQYYSQCLQTLIIKLEATLDEGLGLTARIDGRQYGTEFDPDDLIWLDTATRMKAAGDGIGGAGLSPDEARKRYHGLGPVAGGDSPYMQQQYFSLAALAERDAAHPFVKPEPPAPPFERKDLNEDVIAADAASELRAWFQL